MTRIRGVEVLRAGWGAALLIDPDRVLRDVHHIRIDRRSRVVTRILGARHLAQAVLSGLSPSREVLAMGVWVDAAHATTAVTFALTDRSRARGGLTDAAIAGGYALAGWRDLDIPGATDPRHDRRRDNLARWTLRHLPGGHALLHRARRPLEA